MSKYWREMRAVAQRILTELLHRRRSLIFWLVFPVSVLLLNGVIVADRAMLPLGTALELAAPATLVGAAFFFSCVGGTVAIIVSEREQQTLKRLFLSPLSGIGYFLGICVAQGAIALLQTLVISLLAILLGAKFDGSILLGFSLILLSIISYVGVGFILGTLLAQRAEDVNSLVAAFGVPLLILGGAFIPTIVFPETLLKIAQFNPIYHMNESFVKVWANGETLIEIRQHFFILLGFTLAMITGGWFFYQRMLKIERQL
ncbi:ABC transporter permease [Spirulina sp. CS-785/01]|uniref:ABC transporter permease n=1 Tax=Spirulina sp. CS-785/01 TaxID=3021716 RepID=UPI0023309734|nr:ABC transporter permease [Spirulina sp. CS-785/01]MDB9315315.1 ABC transporter permease [Spirulina sp. CS-785/01]